MAITFIPNDPFSTEVVGANAISITPTPDRPPNSSGLLVANIPPEAAYAATSPEFVTWQAREAALRAIVAFEQACGPLPEWRGDPGARSLDLIPIAGQDINAYYDRTSISTFEYPLNGSTIYSGASTDVVAHETGHAILDALRPDLWGVPMVEVGAFHEGFGDCIALHTALSDPDVRAALLAQDTNLRRTNFVESTAEQLSDAVRQAVGPNHNAAEPRHAFNTFQWAFPTSLPRNGPPGTLINEDHSLGQIVSGVFYELICGLFPGDSDQPTEDKLKAAADTALSLTVRAIAQAPIKPRFFEAWGRSMAVIDRESMDGANRDIIKSAFAAHGIAVGATNFLSPRLRLGVRGKRAGISALATPTNKRLVREALGVVASSPLAARAVDFGTTEMAEFVGRRDVDLTGVDPRLDNVHAPVAQPVIVGEVDGSTALLGAIDSGFTYDAEVRAYAAALSARDQIEYGRSAKKAVAEAAAAGTGFIGGVGIATHKVVLERGQRVLKRVAFSCGCPRK